MREFLKTFYTNKKVLITGHTGFKGAWLSLWLLDLGAEVAGYALAPDTDPNLYDILGLGRRVNSFIGDVRDRERLRSFVSDFRPEIVIHMAAQPLVRCSYEDPVLTYETNVMGTVNVLEVCRDVSTIKAIINVTSDKCYQNHGENRPYFENDPMGGHDPYSSSKGCSELITGAYLRSFFPPEGYAIKHKTALASARAGNVIGGGDWSMDRLLPDCIKAILANKDIVIRYPDAVRPWQYVLEPLYGYLLLAKKLYEDGSPFSGPWNFGPGEKNEKPVKWIVDKLDELWEGGIKWGISEASQPYEAAYLRLDSNKALSSLGWESSMDLSRTLLETVEWYKTWAAKEDMYEYSLGMLRAFMTGNQK